jgi:hypothetical protein
MSTNSWTPPPHFARQPRPSRWLFLRDRVLAAVTPLDDPAAWRPKIDAK